MDNGSLPSQTDSPRSDVTCQIQEAFTILDTSQKHYKNFSYKLKQFFGNYSEPKDKRLETINSFKNNVLSNSEKLNGPYYGTTGPSVSTVIKEIITPISNILQDTTNLSKKFEQKYLDFLYFIHFANRVYCLALALGSINNLITSNDYEESLKQVQNAGGHTIDDCSKLSKNLMGKFGSKYKLQEKKEEGMYVYCVTLCSQFFISLIEPMEEINKFISNVKRSKDATSIDQLTEDNIFLYIDAKQIKEIYDRFNKEIDRIFSLYCAEFIKDKIVTGCDLSITGKIKELQQKNEALEEKNKELEDKIAGLEQKKQEIENNKSKEIEDLKTKHSEEIAAAKKRYNNVVEDYTFIVKEMEEAHTQKIANLEEKHELGKNKLEHEKNKLRDEVEKNKVTISSKSDEIEGLEKKVAENQQSLQEQSKEIERLRDKVKEQTNNSSNTVNYGDEVDKTYSFVERNLKKFHQEPILNMPQDAVYFLNNGKTIIHKLIEANHWKTAHNMIKFFGKKIKFEPMSNDNNILFYILKFDTPGKTESYKNVISGVFDLIFCQKSNAKYRDFLRANNNGKSYLEIALQNNHYIFIKIALKKLKKHSNEQMNYLVETLNREIGEEKFSFFHLLIRSASLHPALVNDILKSQYLSKAVMLNKDVHEKNILHVALEKK